MRQLLLLFLFVTPGIFGFTQRADRADTFKLYRVGYKNMIRVDSSRQYKKGTQVTDRLHFRPVEIDIWYPASWDKIREQMHYGEFLSLLEQRSNRFQNDTLYKNMTSELVQYICANLGMADSSGLTRLKTSSYMDAREMGQKFPLIVYMCAFNGMSYENINLLESLASRGYVVASISSVGRYPGNMSIGALDLMEQTQDGIFAIDALKNDTNVDDTNIGIIGYSWGGLAALGLAMHCDDLKAILSLDGSEMHYYGDSEQEDSSFNTLRNSLSFGLSKTHLPYAYLESGSKQEERNTDSIFNMLPLINGQKIYLRFPKTVHENFTGLLSLKTQGTETVNKNRQFYDLVKRFALNYFDNCLKHQTSGLSSQLSSIRQTHEVDTIYPIANNGDEKALLVIKGKIIDAKNRISLGYANIGVPGKNIGTVAQSDGSFIIKMKTGLKNDSIRISMVGYQSRVYRIADLLDRSQGAAIPLFEKANDLKEVVVNAKIGRKKKIGNSSTSKFISFGFPLKFLGSEIGIRISLGRKPVLLNDFSFTVSENRLDTAIFRLNIYNLKNGVPFENIIGQNVFAYVGKKPGTYRINLRQFNIRMQGDVFIALEWIQGTSAIPKTGAIFLSAGLLSSSTWHRQTSEAEWKKFAAIGVGFNVSVQQ